MLCGVNLGGCDGGELWCGVKTGACDVLSAGAPVFTLKYLLAGDELTVVVNDAGLDGNLRLRYFTEDVALSGVLSVNWVVDV